MASQPSSAPQGHACAIRRQSPRGATCSGRAPLATRRLAGLSATPWRRMTATRVSRAGHTSFPVRRSPPDAGAQSCAHANPCCERHVPTARWPPLGRPAIRRRSGLQPLPSRRRGNHLLKTNHVHHDPERRRVRLPLDARATLCLVALAACTVALIRSGARDRGRETQDHNAERSITPLLQQARDVLWVVMLAACTVALIRSQVLTSGPPVVPACELVVLAAVLGPKPPPPRPQARVERA